VGKGTLFVAIWAAVATSAALIGLTAVNSVQDAVLGTEGVTALTSAEVSQGLAARTNQPTPSPTGRVVAPTAHPSASSLPSREGTAGTSSVRPTPTAAQASPANATPSPTPDKTNASSNTTQRSSTPKATPAETQPPAPSPSSTSALIYSTGGTVVAQCTGPQVRLVSSTPAQGYGLKSAGYGPALQIKVVFQSNGDGAEIELGISCHNGSPAEDGGDVGPDH
jgi:cytoskeletal protein RodZ